MRPRAAAALALAVAALLPVAAARVAARTTDEADVRQVVERFLDDLGSQRIETLPAYFAEKATVTTVGQRDDKWRVTTRTADEWIAQLRAQASPRRFAEPLTNVTVRVESGHLAHLRADFTVVVDGKVLSHGVDYFTLVRIGEAWKLGAVSYTSIPGPP